MPAGEGPARFACRLACGGVGTDVRECLREGAGVQNFLTVFRIGAIIVFVALAFFVDARVPSALVGPLPAVPLLAGVGVAMIAALWTYDGWYGATFAAGEMRNPRMSLPRGLIWGTLVIMALYALTKRMLRQPVLDRVAAARHAHGAEIEARWAAPETLAAIADYVEKTITRR